MAKNVNQQAGKRTQVREQSGGVGFSLAAPSVVNSRANTAGLQLLSSAMNFAGQAYGIKAQKDADKNQAEYDQGKKDATEGSVDTAQIEADPEIKNAREHYVSGAQKVLRKADFLTNQKAWIIEYEEGFDKAAPPAELDAWMDEKFTKGYGGMTPEEAEDVLPMMSTLREKLSASHSQGILNSVKEDVATAQYDLASEEYANGSWTYAQMREQMKQTGDPTEVNELATTWLINTALENKDPRVINQAPHLLSNPKYAARLNAAQDKAQSLLDSANQQDFGAARLTREVEVTAMAERGEYTLEMGQKDLASDYGHSHEWVRSQILKSTKARLEMASKPDTDKYVAAGRVDLLGLPPAKSQKVVDSFINDIVGSPEEQMAQAIYYSKANGIMYSPHKDIMKTANPAAPEKFKEAMSIYKEYVTGGVPFAEDNVSARQRAQFDAFDHFVNVAGMSEADAFDALKTYDPERGKSMVASKDIKAKLDKGYKAFLDNGWFSKDTTDTPILREAFTKSVQEYYAIGNISPDQAVEFAQADFKRSWVSAKGKVFPVSQGWDHADPEGMYDFAIERNIPEGDKAEDWEIVYNRNSKNDGHVTMRRLDQPFSSVIPIDISKEGAEWKSHKDGVTSAERKKLNEETRMKQLKKVALKQGLEKRDSYRIEEQKKTYDAKRRAVIKELREDFESGGYMDSPERDHAAVHPDDIHKTAPTDEEVLRELALASGIHNIDEVIAETYALNDVDYDFYQRAMENLVDLQLNPPATL